MDGCPFCTVEWEQEISEFVTALRGSGLAAESIATRREHLTWLAKWAARKGINPWDVTVPNLLDWMGEHDWKPNTRHGVRASVARFYEWGYSKGVMERNIKPDIPAIKPAPPKPHPLPNNYYQEALAKARPREKLMLMLAGGCGLRRAEVAQVHLNDIYKDKDGYVLTVHGKGNKDRTIPLPGYLAKELREAGQRTKGYVFPGKDHGHLSPRYVGKLISRLLPREYTMHSARHRFATEAYAVDHDLFTVQDLLGHTNPATTRAYVLADTTLKRHLVEEIAKP